MSGTKTTVREHEAELVVESVERVAEGVVALTLVDPDGGTLPAWTPGAHVDLELGDLVRQYSLCGDPADARSYTVAVLREPESRGGSAYVHESLAAGSRVVVRGPRNHFALVSAARYRFIAGGIGITPMLPMIAEAEAMGADWHLWYRGRARAGMAYCDLLTQYGDRVTLLPGDETGPLDLAAVLADPGDGTVVYACGPERLLVGIEEVCAASWPASALHLERFAAKEIEAPAGGERKLRARARGLGRHPHRAAGQVHLQRRARGGHQRARLLPRRRLRHLRADRARRRRRPPRLGAERVRARGQRRDDGLRLALLLRPPRPGPVRGWP